MKRFIIMVSILLFNLIIAQPDTTWTRTYGGTFVESAYSVQQTNDGGYIIAGNIRSSIDENTNIWLLKTDALGDTAWTKQYGSPDSQFGQCVRQTTDEGFILLGGIGSYDTGDFDIWIIKTNLIGDTLWTRRYGNDSRCSGNSIQQTYDGGYIITGLFTTHSVFTNL